MLKLCLRYHKLCPSWNAITNRLIVFAIGKTPTEFNVNKNPTRCNSMQIFIYNKAPVHVSGVTAPIIRSTKNWNRSLRYRSYYLYRRLRVQFLILLMMAAVTPETCRVVLQWINICILLHLLDFYSHWIKMHGNTSLKTINGFFFLNFGTEVFNSVSGKSSLSPHPERLIHSQLQLIWQRLIAFT